MSLLLLFGPPNAAASDSATQTDTASVDSAPSTTDSAVQTDTASVSAAPSTTDAGTLTDSAAIGVGGVSDSGTTTDSATVSAAPSTTDSASGTDTASIAAAPTATESATQTDTASIVAAASTSDSASLSDSASISAAQSATESASVSDSASVSGAPSATDSTTETETATIAASPSTTDAVTQTDAASLTVSTSDSDSATATDAASLSAAPSDTDSSTQTEAASIAGAPSDVDSATITDSASLDIGGASDAGSLDDAASIALDLSTTDTATLTETAHAQDAGNPTDSDSGSATESASIAATVTTADTTVSLCAEYGSAVYGQASYGCTESTAFVSESASLAIGGISDTAAVTEDASAIQTTSLTASDTDTVTFTESAEVVLSKPPKAGGKGSRPRPLLTRFRREQEPRLLTSYLLAPAPRLAGRGRAGPAPRALSGWLDAPRPRLRSIGYAVNLRHTVARIAAPKPLLHGRGRFIEQIRVRADLRAVRPSLALKATHTPDEAWLLAMLLADSRDAMRAWDTEATKRLSNLQRALNAHVENTDRQQHRLVQAALPHLRHAFSAQRDAILVALPHAAKASVDTTSLLDDPGYKDALVLLIQALEDLQQAGVTLGYTDTTPSDVFDMQNPYVQAAVQLLAQRITGINETTADAIRAVIGDGLTEGLSVAEMGTAIRDLGAFSDARALTIATTESRVALNLGAAASFQEMGATEVLIADGDYDEACADLDGTTQTLEWYMANPISHPNCRRTATAIPAAVPA